MLGYPYPIRWLHIHTHMSNINWVLGVLVIIGGKKAENMSLGREALGDIMER